jgi:hypothetical protein
MINKNKVWKWKDGQTVSSTWDLAMFGDISSRLLRTLSMHKACGWSKMNAAPDGQFCHQRSPVSQLENGKSCLSPRFWWLKPLKLTKLIIKSQLSLCSSQPARDWKSWFFYCFIFFSFWSSFFWLENYHSLFIPVKFFHYFFIPVFPPFGIFMFLSFASKMVLGPWELPPEAFSRTLFVCFFDCFCALAIFVSYAFKIDLGNCQNCQKELFLEPFSFFSCVGNFSFLCL